MDTAATGAAHGPVFAARATADHAQQREIAVAFRTFRPRGADMRTVWWLSLSDVDIRHGYLPHSPRAVRLVFVANDATPKTVDMVLGILDRGSGIRPGEAHLHGRKKHAVDGKRAQVGASDAGVPQTFAGFEGFNVKAVIECSHWSVPFSCWESK